MTIRWTSTDLRWGRLQLREKDVNSLHLSDIEVKLGVVVAEDSPPRLLSANTWSEEAGDVEPCSLKGIRPFLRNLFVVFFCVESRLF